MKTPPDKCDPALLNRFFDQELEPKEHALVSKHIGHCPSCQKVVREHQSVSTLFKKSLDRELAHADLAGIEERALALIRRKRFPWPMQFKELLVSRRFYAPAAAMVAGVLLFVALLSSPTPAPGPSAIITSFEGDVASVMILETPKSHQTILWISEGPARNGKEKTNQEDRGNGLSLEREASSQFA